MRLQRSTPGMPAAPTAALALTWLVPVLAHCEGLSSAIAPQRLADALEEFAVQSDLQLIYPASLGAGVMSGGAAAGLSVRATLSALLNGTGLSFAFVNDRTITIVADPAASLERNGTGGTARDGDQTRQGGLAHQVASGSAGSSGPSGPTGPPRALGQLVITGSHIAGIDPVGAQVITITRDEIRRRGNATVLDIIRSLPQSFNGGASEDTLPNDRSSQEALFNASRATGFNLRGIGAGGTLVLINGRRLAPGAGDGRFVDGTGIPLAAIERIEVLPDGASAIYGADAVGGVINFMLREDYQGLETQLSWGTATAGSPRNSLGAATLGTLWDSGNAVLSFEYYARERLQAAEREQSAASDLTRLGGDNFDAREGNPGTIGDGSQTWALPRHQDGRHLMPADLIAGTDNLHNLNEGRDLLPEHRRWSTTVTARQDLGARSRAFADLVFSSRRSEMDYPPIRQWLRVPSTNPFYVNPMGGSDPVTVYYSFGRDLGSQHSSLRATSSSLSAGIDWDVARTWQITPSVSYARSRDLIHAGSLVDDAELAAALADTDPARAFNPFGDGSFTHPDTLARIRENAVIRRQTELWMANITAAGTVLSWGDRDVKLALGADYRRQSLFSFDQKGETIAANIHADRRVLASFAELLIPLIDENHRHAGIGESLRLSLAARNERYSDFGNTTMPRIGVSWSPVKPLSFRGSWSKSFKAPALTDLDESRNIAFLSVQRDPAAPSGVSPVLVWLGNSADLQEETANTWTLGADVSIPSHGLSLRATYFDITHRDRVERLDYSSSILQDPVLRRASTPNPSAAQRETVCGGARFFGDPAACRNAPVAALLDMRLGNVAVTKSAGVDLAGRFSMHARGGEFEAGLAATYLLDFSQARFQTSPPADLLNTRGNPIDLRILGDLSWQSRRFGARASVSYASAYHDRESTPGRRIDSWTTLDLKASYSHEATDSSRTGNMEVSIGVQNLLDEDAPFVNNVVGVGYDPENADILGRVVQIMLRKEW